MHQRLRSIARWAVVLAVVVSPWLFGSAEPWAYLLICWGVGIGFTAWLLSLLCDEPVLLRAPLLTGALIALLALVLVQVVPLPRAFVAAVSPLSAEAQAVRADILARIGAAEFVPSLGADGAGLTTLSASAAATRRSLYLFAAYVAAFLVLANTFTDWQQVRRAAIAVVVSVFAMTVLALIQNFSRADAIYWFHKPRFGGAIFGPFTNRNHFAAHVNMALGVALGLLLVGARAPGEPALPTWRSRLAWLFSDRASRLALLGFAVLLMGASVCATLSRGGIVSLVASLALVGAVLLLQKGMRRGLRVLAGVALLIGVAVRWLSWHPLIERLTTLAEVARDPFSNTRSVATHDTLSLFGASPLVGSGFGSFQHVFPIFQSPAVQIGRWLHAHNDYAQLLAEGGCVAAVLAVVAVLAFGRTLAARLPKMTVSSRLFLCGLAAGIVAIGLHSFVDYSLHRPANAFLLSALCAMAVAVAHLPTAVAARPWNAAVRAVALVCLGGLTVFALAGPNELRGELAFARFLHLRRLAQASEGPAAMAAAVRDATAEADEVLSLGCDNPDALCEVSAACVRWSRDEAITPPRTTPPISNAGCWATMVAIEAAVWAAIAVAAATAAGVAPRSA